MREQVSIFRTLDLPGGSLMPFVSEPGERVRILHGSVWITEEGNPHDAFLASGEEIGLASRGLAVIEALEPARIQLYEDLRAQRSLLETATTWWGRVAHWLGRITPRAPVARGTV